MNLTLQQLFGVNCSQDSQFLTITKSDFPLLTPTTNNTAESLLVAILLKVLENFQGFIIDETDERITDENNVPITFIQGEELYDFLHLFVWEPHLINRVGLVVRETIIVQGFEVYEV